MPVKNKEDLKLIFMIFIGITLIILFLIINIFVVINNKTGSSKLVGFSVSNSTSNSQRNEKERKVDNNVEIPEIDILVNALPIIKLNNNNWDRLKSQFLGYEIDENGNLIFPDGYILYCNGLLVNNVIFDNTYTGEIIGNVKVGEDFKTIEKKLGTPTFKSESYIGYKTKEDYVFFYDNEVSVYSNRSISNKDIEELFESYLNKTYGKERTYLLVDIRNNYPDFKIEIDETTDVVTITSVLRQVVGRLDSLGNIELEFYNGYKIANESTKNYIKEKLYLTNDKDLVEIIENERVSGR